MNFKLIAILGGVLILGGIGVAVVSSMAAKSQPISSLEVISEKELEKRVADDAKKTTSTETTPTPEPVIEEPVVEEPIVEEPTTLEAITQAFADKYGKPLSEINVTITQETNSHAKGGVSFGAGGPGEGGLFLATKLGENWVLVFDGNGSIACADLAPYNFPMEMIGEVCY